MSAEEDPKNIMARRHSQIKAMAGDGNWVQFAQNGKVTLDGDFDAATMRLIAESLDEVNAATAKMRQRSHATAAVLLGEQDSQ